MAFDKNKAFEVMKEGISLMDSYWLSAGTMLGIYRDGDFIDWDTDIDVETFTPVDVGKFAEHGFHLIKVYTYGGHTYQQAFSKDGILFDVYTFISKGDVIYNYNDFGLWEQPRHLFEPLGKYEWKGIEWNVPNDIEAYLEQRYITWQTPIKKELGDNWSKFAKHLQGR